jgi:hypothetical protein
VSYRHRPPVESVIGRALLLSTTSPTVLGERRQAFEAPLLVAVLARVVVYSPGWSTRGETLALKRLDADTFGSRDEPAIREPNGGVGRPSRGLHGYTVKSSAIKRRVPVVQVTNWLRSAGSPRETALKSRLKEILGCND